MMQMMARFFGAPFSRAILRRSLWLVGAGALFMVALTLGAGAAAIALAERTQIGLPFAAALLALALSSIATIALLVASRRGQADLVTDAVAPAFFGANPAAGLASLFSADAAKGAVTAVVVDRLMRRPATTLAIAAGAGLLLAALDGLNDRVKR